jgi:hypothetical protein
VERQNKPEAQPRDALKAMAAAAASQNASKQLVAAAPVERQNKPEAQPRDALKAMAAAANPGPRQKEGKEAPQVHSALKAPKARWVKAGETSPTQAEAEAAFTAAVAAAPGIAPAAAEEARTSSHQAANTNPAQPDRLPR